MRMRITGGRLPRSAWWRTGLAAAVALGVTLPVAAGNPCAECHEDQIATFQLTLHRGVAAESDRLCVVCHGDGALHMESGEGADIRGPEALADWSVTDQESACLSCHEADFPAADEVQHRGLVSCWTCHSKTALHNAPNDAAPAADETRAQWELCTSCHTDTRAEFRLQYRHPVEEGLVACSDCHDIHGQNPQSALERQQFRAACITCHQEQRGPYLFEHLAMEEGCVSCHRPHGSWNRALLTTTGNGTCMTCHLQSNFPGVGPTPHDFKLNGGARCWDCHSEVHGSNTTPDLNPRGRR